MGAAASIEAQSKDPSLFRAMILDCPFDSTENVVKDALRNVQFSLFGYKFDLPGRSYLEKHAFHPYVQAFIKFMLKTVAHMDAKNIETYIYRFSPADSIKHVSIPCFFIRCKRDERVSDSAIRAIYRGAQGPKWLWITNGRRHYDSVFYNPEQYENRVTKFFELVLKDQVSQKQLEKVMEDKEEEEERKEA